MSTKLLTNSPLQMVQEIIGYGQLPCLSSTMRSLNTILRTSSDAICQSSHPEEDKNKILPEDSSTSQSSQRSKCSTDNLITTRSVLSLEQCSDEVHTNTCGSIQKNKTFTNDDKLKCTSPKDDDKENELHCSDNNFMLAMLSDTLNLTSKCFKSVRKDNIAVTRPLKEFNSDITEKSCNSVANICIGKDYKEEADSSIKISRSTKVPQSIPGIHQPRPFTVSIEGNIGSGKSTFLKHFATIPDVATYQEPLWKWTDVGGHNLLGKMYEDTKRWGFLFQSYVQLTRLNIHLNNDQNAKVKLIERSLHNNRYCFVESGHDCGDLQDSEYNVLCEYFEFLVENLNLGIDLIVYLRSTPEVVHQRMQQRGRAEEAGVPLAYLQRLHDYYERWLIQGTPHKPPAPVLVIDADSDLTTVTRDYIAQKQIILGQVPYQGERRGEKRAAEVSDQETLIKRPDDDNSL